MMQLELRDIQVRYGDVEALCGVDVAVGEGEFFTIVGPTNAGKSSLLKTVAGLVRPVAGSVSLGGREVTGLAPRERNVSLLFQNIALFPNLSGFENIAFPLRVAGVADDEVRRRVQELGELLRVSHVLDRMPRTFSGGEQQRVAIGRSIAARTDLLMLDEPLTNLDARIRIALRVEFKNIHRSLRQTLLYVTHDQVEAMSMSDRIAVLNQGRFEQVGTPDEIYHRPATRFVAEFFGSPPMNMLRGRLVDDAGERFFEAGGVRFPLPAEVALGDHRGAADTLSVGVRSETVRVAGEPGPDTPLALPVRWVEHYGSHAVVELALGDEPLRVRVPADSPAVRADRVCIGFDIGRHNLLDVRTDRFLS